jgi:hypothetical protein
MAEMSPRDRARLGYSLFLKKMAEVNAGDVATLMNVSDSKVSGLKTEKMEECIALLAHIGLKVVPTEHVCMSRDAHTFLTASHARIVKCAPQLLWGEED